MTFRFFSLVSLSALLLGGCDCGGTVDTEPCSGDDQCEATMACVDGMCVARPDSGATTMDAGGGVDAGPSDPPDSGPGMDAGVDGGVLPPGACTIEPSASPFENPQLELHWDATGQPFPNHSHSVMSPIVIDFLDDPGTEAVPEIIFASYSGTFSNPGVIRVVSGRAPYETRMTLAGDGTGPVLDDSMASPSILKDAHPAAGDLDGDGRPELVVLIQGGGMVALHSDGSEYWRITAADLPSGEFNSNGSVAIADFEGDGVPEVAVGRTVIEGRTGVVRFTGASARGRNGQGPLSCIADIVPTSEGQELIAGHTVYSATGAILWEGTPANDGFCAVTDITDATGAPGRDGLPEVVRVASGTVYVHDGATGAVHFTRNIPSCGSCRGGAPTVADFDADGQMEIGVAGSTRYAVIDLECAAADTPAGCAGAGLLWATVTEDGSSHVTSSTVFDFNGDGAAEVVYNDEEYFLVLEGTTGAVIFREPNPSRTRTEQPVVADVDNDGNAEIVFSANAEHSVAGSGIPAAERLPGVEIWSSADDTWVGARPIWNQHTYHITNVGPGGSIPAPELPSWTEHGTYRLNRPLEDALAAPDLGATLGTFDMTRCGEGILRVCTDVHNRGDVRVGPGLTVIFYDGDPDAAGVEIGRAMTTGTIDRASFETVCIDWDPAPLDPRNVFVRVDAEDIERECIEDNNVVDLGPGECTVIE